MREMFINWQVRFRGWTFIQILQRSMTALFPIALIGSFCWAFSQSFLTSDSFFGSLTNIKAWLPNYQFIAAIIADISQATSGLLAIYAAYISAELTIEHYKKRSIIVGISSMASYILIFLHTVRDSRRIEMSYYSAFWFIFGIVVGYVVGVIFGKFGKDQSTNKANRNTILEDVFANITPLLISLGIALGLHILFAIYRSYQADVIITRSVTAVANRHSSYGLSIFISFLTTLGLWFGYGGTLNFNNTIFDNESVANLSYALSHKSSWNIPYPYTLNALFGGFAQLGGTGAILSLTIAVALFSKNKQHRKVAVYSSFPVFFNISMPVAVGLPTILNPIYLIPFVISPILNMLLGSVAIWFKLFPPLVYPIPNGTPGVLGPLMGTGGNISALIFTIFLVIVDAVIYLPFVKLGNEVERRYQEIKNEEI